APPRASEICLTRRRPLPCSRRYAGCNPRIPTLPLPGSRGISPGNARIAMRKDSPLVACSIAALIVVVAGAALMPSAAWHGASVVARLAPTLASTASGHGFTVVRAAGVGVLSVPALLRDAPPAAKPHEPQVRVCRRELPRTSCNRPVECPQKVMFQRLHPLFPLAR